MKQAKFPTLAVFAVFLSAAGLWLFTVEKPAAENAVNIHSVPSRLRVFALNLFIDKKESEEAVRINNLDRKGAIYIGLYDDSIFLYRIMKKGDEWWVFRRLNPDDERVCAIANGGESLSFYKNGDNYSPPGLFSSISSDGAFGDMLRERNLLCPSKYHIYNEKGERELCFFDGRPKPKCDEARTKKPPPENPEVVKEIFKIALKHRPLLSKNKAHYRVYIRRHGKKWLVMRKIKPFDPISCKTLDDWGSFVLTIEDGGITNEKIGATFDSYTYENFFTCAAYPDLYDENGKRTRCLPGPSEEFFKSQCW